jgi:hypothetical protein
VQSLKASEALQIRTVSNMKKLPIVRQLLLFQDAFNHSDAIVWEESDNNEPITAAYLISKLYAALEETLEVAARNEEGAFADRARKALEETRTITKNTTGIDWDRETDPMTFYEKFDD